MTIKTAIVALTLTCLPVASFAMGCFDHKVQTQSCAAGTVWDADSRTCVKQVTG
ncbi:MAG: carbohydrate-binding module family 14 protein [Arenibacterium sp.]